MQKAIVLLSGSPTAKERFIELAGNTNEIVSVNAKNYLGTKAESFYWNGNKDESYYEFISDFSKLTNKHFDFEKKYLKEELDRFQADEGLTDLLIIHGVSKDLVELLKSEYGVFKIHIELKNQEAGIGLNDLILHEDDDFDKNVMQTIGVLTKPEKV